MFYIVIKSVLTILAFIVIGFCLRRKSIISREANKEFSFILLNIVNPSFILVSMQRLFYKEFLYEGALIFALTFLVHFISIALGGLICKVCRAKQDEVGALVFTSTFTNKIFMGIPIISSVYGQGSLPYVYISSIACNFIMYSIGIKIMAIERVGDSKLKAKEIFLNPPVIITIIAFILSLTSVSLPEFVLKLFIIIGSVATPFTMIVVGSILAENSFKEVFIGKKIYIISLIRLIIIPLMMLLILRVFIQNKLIVGILVFIFAMPATGTMAIIANQYNGNYEFSSKIIFITTFLSIFTIPLISLAL